MAAAATSVVVFPEAEEMNAASHPLLVSEVKEDGEEEMRRRRRLFERFMAAYGPGCSCVYEAPKVHNPCVLYTMRVSVKKARVSWSHRRSRRFFPERRGSTFPIPLCRAAGPDDQVEQVLDRSGAPGEPDRPGLLSGIFEDRYDLLELPREKGVIHKEGSAAPWWEVAVIRGMPGGRGITVTSHVERLVVRLHDILFRLPTPSATVDICFTEHWFRLPTGWTEERIYAEDGFHIIDIAAPVKNLVEKLYVMHQQEEEEKERRRLETEEEKDRRLQEEEAVRKREEEERKKIIQRKEEERRRREEEEAAKPPVYADLIWDAALWEINEAAHCYSKFKLLMYSNKQVSCKCIKEEGLHDMRRRVEDGEFVLPISKPGLVSASSRALDTLGFVEGYCDLETFGLGLERGRFMDQSGCTLSSVLMVSRSVAKVLTIEVLVDKLDILLDDGMVMSGGFGVSVDIHCDDTSSSELLTTEWTHHILCKNIDGKGMISFSLLLVQLKKKLQLQLTKEEVELYTMSRIDDVDENEEVTCQRQQKQREWVLDKPERELAEVELRDYSLLFLPETG